MILHETQTQPRWRYIHGGRVGRKNGLFLACLKSLIKVWAWGVPLKSCLDASVLWRFHCGGNKGIFLFLEVRVKGFTGTVSSLGSSSSTVKYC